MDEAVADARVWFQSWHQPNDNYCLQRTYIDFNDITFQSAPDIPPADLGSFESWVEERNGGHRKHSALKQLLRDLSSDFSARHERRYINDLQTSFDLLPNDTVVNFRRQPELLKSRLKEHLRDCKSYVKSVYQTIYKHLQADNSITSQMTREVKMFPRLSPTSLLRHLAIGHQDWSPMLFPDWLLLEIENNILIRPLQSQIAQEMISPSSNANSVMQLNMGKGKLSVIVPMVAAALADQKQLVRVVALRTLSAQMFHLLLKKLGGMLGRRIVQMPISRSLQLDVHEAFWIQDLYKECMHSSGILLVQPEHILSFELLGLERLLAGKSELGRTMIDTQRWLEENSRDILDESDVILSVRFTLIYALGTQQAIEYSLYRWVIIEHVLGLVGRSAQVVGRLFPSGLDIQLSCLAGFPRIRILEDSAGKGLMRMVA
ncbi:MAG: hypothetical protein M1816_002375 [Peltula sp. TS41687]|nr:MAG: hypothetical protein M1816_002375 [Peltula sp. TS41687]